MSTRHFGLLAAWLAATLLAVVLASQAVGLVRDQVTDRPSRTVSTILASVTTRVTTPLVSTPESIDPQAPERTIEPPTTATTTTSPTAATQTTATPTTTTTTTSSEQRYTLVGGWVTVACSGDHISFKSAAPKAGFSVERKEVEDGKVDVKFESSDHTSKFVAECKDGGIVEQIEEQREHGDD